ncbi:hypothetical protein G7Y89_g6015 [Cudoniella acicularis]|uniref:Uncharacterized protein n=1 Tax=Cudoniella acicularis TaxID=354080 RepID=A0A8H4RN16_9HELO|nr:hypothetical protein G7Y89_g6015 [Cudoniella acicularis]
MEPEVLNSCIHLHGYTPVRRLESTINTRQLHDEQEKEWTAARCHRLLRALTSRVAVLKKELSRISAAQTGSSGALTSAGEIRPVKRTWRKGGDDDADWAQARKKLKRTYSGKVGSKNSRQAFPETPRLPKSGGRRALVPGEISVPTPILARARGGQYLHELPSNLTEDHVSCDGEQVTQRNKRTRTQNGGKLGFPIFGSLREIRQKTTTIRYAIYEGIYNGLETLLRSTANDGPEAKRKGPRSLFSMCLKTVPRYIGQEEASLRAHVEETGTKSAINNRDVQREVYDNLEDFGSSDQGWRQLRVIVRAHGVQILADAITSDLLSLDFCGSLITLCINSAAIEEAEVLLCSLLSSNQMPAPRSLYDPAPRSLSMLWEFAEVTGRSSFLFQQINSLISSRLLPLEWLATKSLRQVWTGIMQKLSPGSMNEGALLFLDGSLPLLAIAGVSNNVAEMTFPAAVKHTYSSILTTLLSIFILSRPLVGFRTDGQYDYVAALLRSFLAQLDCSQPSSSGEALLLIANLLVEAQHDENSDHRNSLLKTLLHRLRRATDDSNGTFTKYTDVVAFISSVAQCCGRGASSTGFEHLQLLHSILQKVEFSQPELLQSLVVDSAFAFGQQLPESIHLEYATMLDSHFSARNRKLQVKSSINTSDKSRAGFRWEEGIGEWIMSTPGAMDGREKNIKMRALLAESMIQSPFGLLSQGRRKQTGDEYLTRRYTRSVGCSPKNLAKNPALGTDFDSGQTPPSTQSQQLCSSYFDEMDFEVSVLPASDEENELSFSSSTSAPTESDDDNFGSQFFRHTAKTTGRQLQHSRELELFEDSCISTGSPVNSQEITKVKGDREHIDRAPRLGRRALRSSKNWQLFDESDDELSILSASSQEDHVLRDIAKAAHNRDRSNSKPLTTTKRQKSIPSWDVSLLTDSEDELCI